jgi:hypothetical protein
MVFPSNSSKFTFGGNIVIGGNLFQIYKKQATLRKFIRLILLVVKSEIGDPS